MFCEVQSALVKLLTLAGLQEISIRAGGSPRIRELRTMPMPHAPYLYSQLEAPGALPAWPSLHQEVLVRCRGASTVWSRLQALASGTGETPSPSTLP